MAEQNRENLSPQKAKKTSAYDEPFGNEITSPFDRPAPAPSVNEPTTPAHGEQKSAEERPTPTPSVEKKETHSPKKESHTPKNTPVNNGDGTKSVRKTSSTAKKKTDSPAPKKPVQEPIRSSTANPPKTVFTVNKKDKPQANSDQPRSARTVHQVIPYVLIGLCVFIGLALLLNLFCNWQNGLEDPNDHWMGVVGYGICYGLFGMFGPAAFALPLVLLNLGMFWKRYIDHKLTISKIIASLIFVIMLGTVIHVFCLMAIDEPLRDISASDLIRYGAATTGGGLIGGKLGYFLYTLCRFVGALIIGFLLLGASLFYFLGMTPQHLWNYLRNRRKTHPKRTPTYSEQNAEEAENRVKIEAKIRRTTSGQMNTDDTDFESEAPLGAVRVVRSTAPKKNPEDKIAPMPMPRLDPNDGEDLFVPDVVNEKMAAMEAEEAVATEMAIRQGARAAAEAAQTKKPIDPAANRDAAVEPIFPKMAEPRQARRVPRTDRNFDLKNIFVDPQETDARMQRNHAPVPPEVPMAGARPRTASPTAQPGATRPAAQGASSQAQRPTTVAGTIRTPLSPNGTPAATRPAPTKAPASQAPATPTPKPLPKVPTPAANTPLRRVDPQKQDFGLTNEEFEKLEAGQVILPRAGTKKLANAEQKSETASKPVAKATTPEKASAKPAAKPVKQTAKKYTFPPISYLHPKEPITEENEAELQATVQALSATLKSFHVSIQDEPRIAHGPTVTRYEITPSAGVRVRTITNLADDLALALRSSGGIRIEAPIPGTNAVGIEVPNKTRSTIYLRELIESKAFSDSKSPLTACLGAGIAGEPLIFDIAKMPHLLIAGTTGSGKSVCINCIIMSLLYKVTPDEVKLVMIDPKKVEFSIYKNIPHLMAPVVTTPKDAAGALQASVEEMERRFELFEQVGVRDIKGYNTATADDPDMPSLPHIVIIIDELADLMMTARDEVETAICRIAQKARAAGMHLIIGTQRPSADVVTGLIKSNVPSRIAFAVKSQVDSRVILDHIGAESLTGRGDMLFVPIGSMRDTRVQGAFVDDKEVEKICEFIRATNGTAVYDENFITKLKELAAQCGNKGKGGGDFVPSGDDSGEKAADNKYADAVRIAIEEKRISTSLLQRKLEIGYSRAAKLIDRMQSEGIVSPPDGSKPRTILITPEEYMAKFVDNPEGGEG